MKIKLKFLLIILALAGMGIFLYSTKRPLSLEAYAKKLVGKCSYEASLNACYDREIPKLMEILSMEDVFKVTSLVQQKDSSYTYCHVLGHELASIETRRDPTKWKEVVGRCPAGVCSNGCVHGAFQERYRVDVLSGEDFAKAKKELTDICEEREGFNPSGLEQGSCYHALGHLLMYITGADIKKSILSCDEISFKNDGRDFRGLCYDGAFMQIFQPLEPEDISLTVNIKQTKETTKDFCWGFSGEARISCWTESWPLFFSEITTPHGLIGFCSNLTPEGMDACMKDILYSLPIQLQFNEDAFSDYCKNLPENYKGVCFAMYASRVLEIDYGNIERAVTFCKKVADWDRQGMCFEELVKSSDFVFQKGSENFLILCNSLPEPWKGKCLDTK